MDDEDAQESPSQWVNVPDYLDDWSRVLGTPSVLLPSLTRLVISATSRGMHHLESIAQYAPNLTELTWSCHWKSEQPYNRWVNKCCYAGDTLQRLETLTISGYHSAVLPVAESILDRCPNLANLVVHVPSAAERNITPDKCSHLVEHIAEHRSIRFLAIYGSLLRPLISLLFSIHHEDSTSEIDLKHIGTVVLERSLKYEGETRYYPMMNPNYEQPVLFPSVKHIIYVDRNIDADGHFTLGKIDQTGNDDFFIEEELDRLFEEHGDLISVRYITTYPSKPLDYIYLSDYIKENVKCSVWSRDRSEIEFSDHQNTIPVSMLKSGLRCQRVI